MPMQFSATEEEATEILNRLFTSPKLIKRLESILASALTEQATQSSWVRSLSIFLDGQIEAYMEEEGKNCAEKMRNQYASD